MLLTYDISSLLPAPEATSISKKQGQTRIQSGREEETIATAPAFWAHQRYAVLIAQQKVQKDTENLLKTERGCLKTVQRWFQDAVGPLFGTNAFVALEASLPTELHGRDTTI